jgi:hypothetical protein
MISAPPILGGEYSIEVSGFPVFPADRDIVDTEWPDPKGINTYRWVITITSKKGKLQARTNPGIDHIYLYAYETNVDAAGHQSRFAVDLDGKGNPRVDIGTSVTTHTVFAYINPSYVRYAQGIYNNLRLSLTPVTNVLG